MKKPLISIITATFNAGLVLERFINSVEAQTYTNYELIIVDGGSTDNTLNVVKKYEGKIIKKWISEKDDGIYDAWNKGIKLSSGDWITFMGADDTFYEDSLANYVNFINDLNIDNLDFVSSKMHLVDAKGKLVRSLGWAWNWDICRRKNTIAHPGSLHHRNLFDKIGLFDTSFKICGDYELLLRMSKGSKTAFMNKFTVRMSQGGVSSDGRKLFKEHYRAAITTGKLDIFTAKYYYLYHIVKYHIKSTIRIIGINT